MNLDDAPQRTAAGFTICWGGAVAHVQYRGMTLTPKLEMERARFGMALRIIAGFPVAERNVDGRIVYALPGGGVVVC